MCVTSESIATPIWSPDDTQILISKYNNESKTNEDYHVILIDIQDNYDVEIAKGVFPEGWLITSP